VSKQLEHCTALLQYADLPISAVGSSRSSLHFSALHAYARFQTVRVVRFEKTSFGFLQVRAMSSGAFMLCLCI
jgi:hypothetical protein